MHRIDVYIILLVIGALLGASITSYVTINQNPSTREQVKVTITGMTFETNGNVTIAVTNSGTSAVTIGIVKVNGATVSFLAAEDTTLGAAEIDDLTIDMASSWGAGSKYSVNLFATDGTLISSYTDTA